MDRGSWWALGHRVIKSLTGAAEHTFPRGLSHRPCGSRSLRLCTAISIHWKDWCWSWNSNTWATWCEEPTYQKILWCGERLKAGGEGDDRGWNSWLSSPTQWTWVWASSRSWRWTGRPGELQSRRWQTVGKTEGLNNNRSHYPRKWWMSKEDHHISIWYPH